MKKTFLALGLLSLFSLQSFAAGNQAQSQTDTIVNTTPTYRNALLEEYTGAHCVNCPDGHRIANEIVEEYPGKVFLVNIHASSFAQPSSNEEPDFRTDYGETLQANAGVSGYPAGTVNRHLFNGNETTALNRNQWKQSVKEILDLPAYVNLAAKASVNWETRELKVKVQVYFTDNSSAAGNYLHVFLTQDNIPGYQKGGLNNPEQYLGNNQYLHQHALREILTPIWGDPIGENTKGALVSKEYTLDLPEKIRNIDLDLQDIHIIAFISEDRNEIINACQADLTYENSPEYIFQFAQGKQLPQMSCDNDVRVGFELQCLWGNTQEIDNLEFECQSQDKTQVFGLTLTESKNGQSDKTDNTSGNNLDRWFIESTPLSLSALNTKDTLTIKVKAVNGKDCQFENQKKIRIPVEKLVALTNQDSAEIVLWQDAFGSETHLYYGEIEGDTLLAEGPYSDVAISNRISHTYTVPVSDGCYYIKVTDEKGDGINNGFGEGKLEIKRTTGEIFFEHNGDFTDSLVVMLAYSESAANQNVWNPIKMKESPAVLYPNPASSSSFLLFKESLSGKAILSIWNILGKKVYEQSITEVEAMQEIELPVSNFTPGLYLIKLQSENQGYLWKLVVR